MPPKASRARVEGLEHCGFVVGDGLENFKKKNGGILTGVQDQGPYCRPAYIVFDDGLRVKFYQYSLKRVVELEGGTFAPVNS